MSIEKCSSIVLFSTPYRESSLLLHLFSREHGRIHGLAKGIRKADRRNIPVERGCLIDHLMYLKPNRDLHLVTECALREHFPGIRGNLEKTAVRDLLFDIILGSITVTDPHPELFDFLSRYLRSLDMHPSDGSVLLLHLTKTLFGFVDHLGFGIDFSKCVSCGKAFALPGASWLSIESGLLQCGVCSPSPRAAERRFPVHAVGLLAAPDDVPMASLPVAEALGIMRCACDYCAYHLEIRRRLDSLAFVSQLFGRRSGTGLHDV